MQYEDDLETRLRADMLDIVMPDGPQEAMWVFSFFYSVPSSIFLWIVGQFERSARNCPGERNR